MTLSRDLACVSFRFVCLFVCLFVCVCFLWTWAGEGKEGEGKEGEGGGVIVFTFSDPLESLYSG